MIECLSASQEAAQLCFGITALNRAVTTVPYLVDFAFRDLGFGYFIPGGI